MQTDDQLAAALFAELVTDGWHDEEVRGYLETRCPGKPDIHATVIAMLRSAAVPPEGAIFDQRPDADDPLIGHVVGGRYQIEALLPGQGGMGTVYRATWTSESGRRPYVVKVLPTQFNTPAFVERFERERKVLLQLQNPRIVSIADTGTLPDGRPFYVMEWVPDALPLDQYCHDRALGVDARLTLMADVCAAVQYAHQQGVVHRDLKPGNIVVTPDGHVKLLDFGVAMSLDEQGPITVAGERLGTPQYMSPEQAHGRRITQKSDQYSIGVILFELLTTKRPYDLALQSSTALEAVFDVDPPRPSTVAGKAGAAAAVDFRAIDSDLEHVVLYALRRDPDDRYQSVAHLRDDIERYRAGLPVNAQPPTIRYRARKFAVRHRWQLSAAAAVIVALVAIAVLQTRANVRLQQAGREREKALRRAQTLLAGMVEQEAVRALESGNVDEAARLVALAPAAATNVVGQVIRSEVSRFDLGLARTWSSPSKLLYDRESAQTFSQGDESVSRNASNSTPASSGALHGYLLTPPDGAPYIVGVDRDTAFGVKRAERDERPDTLCRVILATMECQPLFEIHGSARGGSVDPARSYLSFVDGDGWHLMSKAGAPLDHVEAVTEARWIGRDRLLMVAFDRVSVYDVATKARRDIRELAGTEQFTVGPAGVLAAQRNEDLLLFDHRSMKLVGAIKARPSSVAFNSSGQKLALLIDDEEVQTWALDPDQRPGNEASFGASLLDSNTGKYPGLVFPELSPRVSFSRDDSVLLVSGHDPRLLAADSLRTLVKFDAFTMMRAEATFYSPQDRIGLSAFVPTTGEWLHTLSTSGLASRLVFRAPADAARFSPDGRFVLAIAGGVSVFDLEGRKLNTIAGTTGAWRQPEIVTHRKTSDVVTLYGPRRLARWTLNSPTPVWTVDIPGPERGSTEQSRSGYRMEAVRTPVWSDDGAWVAVRSGDYLILYDALSGREVARAEGASRTNVLRFVNGTLRVGYTTDVPEATELVESVHSLPTLTHTATVRERETDSTFRSDESPSGGGRCLAADLERLNEGSVFILDAGAKTPLLRLEGFESIPASAAIHPAGTLALVVAGSEVSVWNLGVKEGTTACRGDR
jgi:hypothetical protein